MFAGAAMERVHTGVWASAAQGRTLAASAKNVTSLAAARRTAILGPDLLYEDFRSAPVSPGRLGRPAQAFPHPLQYPGQGPDMYV